MFRAFTSNHLQHPDFRNLSILSEKPKKCDEGDFQSAKAFDAKPSTCLSRAAVSGSSPIEIKLGIDIAPWRWTLATPSPCYPFKC